MVTIAYQLLAGNYENGFMRFGRKLCSTYGSFPKMTLLIKKLVSKNPGSLKEGQGSSGLAKTFFPEIVTKIEKKS